MKSKFIVFLTIFGLFACRKDEVIITEYINVIAIENESLLMQISDPQLILVGNTFKFIENNDTIITIDLGNNRPQIGKNQPKRINLPFGSCDDNNINCMENFTFNLVEFSEIDEFVKGELSGRIEVNGKLEEIRISFNVILNDEYQRICGQFWLDINQNHIFDINENGINGLKVKVEANGTEIDVALSGLKLFTPYEDGYFELNASTKYPNDITIILPEIGLELVEKNVGNNPLIDSDFDTNGQIKGLVVNRGEKIVINAGLRIP